jgi:hypothetical protein
MGTGTVGQARYKSGRRVVIQPGVIRAKLGDLEPSSRRQDCLFVMRREGRGARCVREEERRRREENSEKEDAYHWTENLRCYSQKAAAHDLSVDYLETWSKEAGDRRERRSLCAFLATWSGSRRPATQKAQIRAKKHGRAGFKLNSPKPAK